jgi:hypothetical protein
MVERFALTVPAVQRDHFLFDWRPVSLGVPEVIAIRLELQEAVAQAPVVEAEYQYEAEQAAAELNSWADPALPGICESGPHRIPVASV